MASRVYPATVFGPDEHGNGGELPTPSTKHFRLDDNSNAVAPAPTYSIGKTVARKKEDFQRMECNPLYRLLMPLFAVMRIYGMEIDPMADVGRHRRQGACARIRWCSALYRSAITLIIVLFHVFCIACDFGVILKLNKAGLDMDATSERMCAILLYGAAMTTHILVVAKQGKIRSLFGVLMRVPAPAVDRNRQPERSESDSGADCRAVVTRLRPVVAAAVILPYAFCACLVAVDVVRVVALDESVSRFRIIHFSDYSDKTIRMTYYRKVVENFTDDYLTMRKVNLYAQQAVWGLITFPLFLLGVAIFVLVCVIMKQHFRTLVVLLPTPPCSSMPIKDGERLEISSRSDNGESLIEENSQQPRQVSNNPICWTSDEAAVCSMVKRHRMLCDVLSIVDATFSSMNFYWSGVEVFGLTCAVRAMNLSSGQQWRPELLRYVTVLIVTFACKSIVASSLNAQVVESFPLIKNGFAYINHNDNSDISKVTRSRLNLYMQTVIANPVAITGGGFFSYGKGFFLTVGGTILTYVVVLYGFQ